MTNLTPNDYGILERLLSNESETAYRRRAKQLIEYLEVQHTDYILDCGCGYGLYPLLLTALRNSTVVGVDINDHRLKIGQTTVPSAHFIQGQDTLLPFPDNLFDKIILSEVLEHLPNEHEALREIWRVLRPGGTLAVSVPHSNYPLWWDPINWIWTRLGGQPFRHSHFGGIWEGHVRLYQPSTLIQRIEEAGFRVSEYREATHYALPCLPYLVYGVGKVLIEHNLLPNHWRSATDRLRGGSNTLAPYHPIRMMLRLIYSIDSLNECTTTHHTSFVNILVKAHKPQL